MDLPLIDDYQQLFTSDTPLLDVRAPVEFRQGAFPHAQNLPLLNDEERRLIGIRYKERGQDKAIELGHTLVSGEVKESRVSQWAEFIHQYPQGALYCFRGGLRSKICQQWIAEKTGVAYPRIKGGYKALRRYLLNELDFAAQRMHVLLLSGRTGVGKTLLLNRIGAKIDLENIYHHRGSAFGKHATPQPSQIDVENTLAVALLKHRVRSINKLVLEDEAANIGSRRLPQSVVLKMQWAPLIILQAEISERVDIVFNDYILQALREHQTLLGQDLGFTAWAGNLRAALDKIQRRLGGERHQSIKSVLEDAVYQHLSRGDPQQHQVWIRLLLEHYYDPMYDYQLARKSERVLFRGNREEILDYLARCHGIS